MKTQTSTEKKVNTSTTAVPWDAGAFSSRCGALMLMWPRLYQVRHPLTLSWTTNTSGVTETPPAYPCRKHPFNPPTRGCYTGVVEGRLGSAS